MQIESLGVVGCGLMGHGIVQVAAQAGLRVVAVESDQGALDRGIRRIEQSLAKLAQKDVEKGRATAADAGRRVGEARSRIAPSLDTDALRGCDLVIEAIIEDLPAKNALFAALDRICKRDTVFASNTSSFPIGEMAKASGRPTRLIGLHFFNPVQLMRLVEVVRLPQTDEAVLAAARKFAERCGKTAIECRDTPGFVVNRLLVPFMVQALAMAERGDASIADIDTAMQLGCGHPMGPITLADYVGLDTTLSILEGWCARFPDEPAFAIPGILRERVRAGKLGRKSGAGFYAWDGDRRLAPT